MEVPQENEIPLSEPEQGEVVEVEEEQDTEDANIVIEAESETKKVNKFAYDNNDHRDDIIKLAKHINSTVDELKDKLDKERARKQNEHKHFTKAAAGDSLMSGVARKLSKFKTNQYTFPPDSGFKKRLDNIKKGAQKHLQTAVMDYENYENKYYNSLIKLDTQIKKKNREKEVKDYKKSISQRNTDTHNQIFGIKDKPKSMFSRLTGSGPSDSNFLKSMATPLNIALLILIIIVLIVLIALLADQECNGISPFENIRRKPSSDDKD